MAKSIFILFLCVVYAQAQHKKLIGLLRHLIEDKAWKDSHHPTEWKDEHDFDYQQSKWRNDDWKTEKWKTLKWKHEQKVADELKQRALLQKQKEDELKKAKEQEARQQKLQQELAKIEQEAERERVERRKRFEEDLKREKAEHEVRKTLRRQRMEEFKRKEKERQEKEMKRLFDLSLDNWDDVDIFDDEIPPKKPSTVKTSPIGQLFDLLKGTPFEALIWPPHDHIHHHLDALPIIERCKPNDTDLNGTPPAYMKTALQNSALAMIVERYGQYMCAKKTCNLTQFDTFCDNCNGMSNCASSNVGAINGKWTRTIAKSISRGVSSCNNGGQLIGGVCYGNCAVNDTAVNAVCYKSCGSHEALTIDTCAIPCPKGYYRAFTGSGCVQSVTDPGIAGTTYARASYPRPIITPTCQANETAINGLCYGSCHIGYERFGIYCLKSCPLGTRKEGNTTCIRDDVSRISTNSRTLGFSIYFKNITLN